MKGMKAGGGYPTKFNRNQISQNQVRCCLPCMSIGPDVHGCSFYCILSVLSLISRL